MFLFGYLRNFRSVNCGDFIRWKGISQIIVYKFKRNSPIPVIVHWAHILSHISVYAKKVGYADSDIATATLCWIDTEPVAEGTKEVEDNVTELKAFPVLIQAKDNTIIIQGVIEGSEISVYNSNGIKLGSTLSKNGKAEIVVPRQFESIVIVKIGVKAIKVLRWYSPMSIVFSVEVTHSRKWKQNVSSNGMGCPSLR